MTNHKCRILQQTARVFVVLFVLLAGVRLASAQNGFGGYDLKSTSDMAFAFDYNSTGNLDHIVFYRPGSGVVYIEEKQSGAYVPVFTSFSGIGGYDLQSKSDRLLAFDYSGNGHADHLLCYRPGTGIVWILANSSGNFFPVFTSTSGIGGYDLSSAADRALAFDYDGSGKYDHLVLYRPGTGMVSIVQNTTGVFSTKVSSTTGLGGYDLASTQDQMIAFDYYGVGIGDHLVAYRPGSGVVYVLENFNGTGNFITVASSTTGIGGFDLKSQNDRLVAYDFGQTGSQDHMVAYRPGTGYFSVIQSAYLAYSTIFSSSNGVGGYDLKSTADRVFTFDYNSNGLLGTLGLYRPGQSDFYIETNTNGDFVAQVKRSDAFEF